MHLLHIILWRPLSNILYVLGLESKSHFIYNESLPHTTIVSQYDLKITHKSFRCWRVEIDDIAYVDFKSYTIASELFQYLLSAKRTYIERQTK
jgi:hypothetical protein